MRRNESVKSIWICITYFMALFPWYLNLTVLLSCILAFKENTLCFWFYILL